MFSYVLSNRAVEDLSDIWDYTFEEWSERQADKYYEELLESCQKLANKEEIEKIYKEIDKDIYFHKSGKHLIFYRIRTETEIEIVRFLHSRMNLKEKIEE